MSKSPDPIEYREKVLRLTQLLALEESGYLKLYFADESGFSLTPTVPYGWQEIGKTESIPSQRSERVNLFGLLARDNTCVSYRVIGSMNSAAIIAFIDDFSKSVQEKTVIVMDNAPPHKSKKFKAKMEEWKKKDILIWFLPPYSPHLNIIEILWRKIKHTWLRPKDYTSMETLLEALDTIMSKVGDTLTINFKEPDISMKAYVNTLMSFI